MDLGELQRVDRPTWRKYLFYFDLGWFFIFAISLVLLIRHAFEGGQYFERGEFNLSTESLWRVVADTVFLVASFVWIIYRFFQNQYIVLTRRF